MSKQLELDRWCMAFLDGDMSAGQFKRAVANLVTRQSNKQVEEVLDRLGQKSMLFQSHNSITSEAESFYSVPMKLIEAERNKLKESN